jgi:hypothetical protein
LIVCEPVLCEVVGLLASLASLCKDAPPDLAILAMAILQAGPTSAAPYHQQYQPGMWQVDEKLPVTADDLVGEKEGQEEETVEVIVGDSDSGLYALIRLRRILLNMVGPPHCHDFLIKVFHGRTRNRIIFRTLSLSSIFKVHF